MAAINNKNLNTMRNDAIRRSREMYMRSNNMNNKNNNSTNNNVNNNMNNHNMHNNNFNYKNTSHQTAHPIKPDIPKEEPMFESENQKSNSFNNTGNNGNYNNIIKSFLPEGLSGLFNGKLDSDKLTILALMFILIKEGADLKLILALGYILM